MIKPFRNKAVSTQAILPWTICVVRINRYLLKKSGKVFVCFVDFRKSFDTINRSVLQNVLRKSDVCGKMLRILHSMYISVRSCVRCPDNLTEVFFCFVFLSVLIESDKGVCFSPTLFSFLLNELALDIAQNGMYGIQLAPDVVQILIMLFADDVLLLSLIHISEPTRQ